jgi:hypothetical protein
MAVNQQSFGPRLRHEMAAGAVEESTSGKLGRPWKGLALRA